MINIDIKKWSFIIVNKESLTIGSEQTGCRPAIVLAKFKNGKYLIAYISSAIKNFITHVPVELDKPSEIMLEQLDSITQHEIYNVIGEVTCKETQNLIEQKFKLSVSSNLRVPSNQLQVKRGNIVVFKDNNKLKKGIVISNDRGNLKSTTIIIQEENDDEIKTIDKRRVVEVKGFFQNSKKLERTLKNLIS